MLYTVPMAGDAVQVLGHSAYEYQSSMIGVIEGAIDVVSDQLSVCFRPSAFRNDRYVSCSGGPVPYIGAQELIPSGKSVVQNFWRWKDGLQGAGRGEYYMLEVPLWYWNPENHQGRVDRALNTYRFWKEENALYVGDAQHAAAILGYPITRRPRTVSRKQILGFFDKAVPDVIKYLVQDICDKAEILGSSDAMYMSNYIAMKTGTGDGSGKFWGGVIAPETAQLTASGLFSTYRTCFRNAKMSEADLAGRLVEALC